MMGEQQQQRTSGGGDSALVRLRLCWIFAALWLPVFLWSTVQAGFGGAAFGLQVLCTLLFVVTHASLSNGWRGGGLFFVFAVSVAFVLEASSIATGFPFGFYVHNVAGFKLLGVPPLVAFIYAIFGWLAWNLARLIVRQHPCDAGGVNRFTTPLVASFILAAQDLPFDPIGSTVLGIWTFRSPSGYFGVPLTNFLGWMFTGWVFFQLFALVESRFPPHRAAVTRASYWLLPCFIWAMNAVQYPIKFASASAGSVTVAGRTFVTADVYESSVVVALLTMMFTAVTAAFRVGAIVHGPLNPNPSRFPPQTTLW
ncbi:carotenoid biosynthesis protein [Vitiosangium sp. GDMCC 1.1324]|uniref:carotenoid biosynthesis protein n=1 Tax=Vitiosangium sp. (strain GDMCC 1.1324) TaxID=2138576 RepID=UPI000D3CFD7B|nr:carotenoid biosynthesis protein [Vitiosangium sp. GDMCC 1.1324]PTL75604.1 carotenoid biosynthesis protein [Vitiosangium sp. GDMCC 1.1324]